MCKDNNHSSEYQAQSMKATAQEMRRNDCLGEDTQDCPDCADCCCHNQPDSFNHNNAKAPLLEENQASAAHSKAEAKGVPLSVQSSWLTGKKQAIYTIEEVQRHDQSSDCWLVAHGLVYDATSFMNVHPGGPCILRRGGKDATRDFEFHSREGKKAWKKFQIGWLQGAGGCSVM